MICVVTGYCCLSIVTYVVSRNDNCVNMIPSSGMKKTRSTSDYVFIAIYPLAGLMQSPE
jgi:hypothetical protein